LSFNLGSEDPVLQSLSGSTELRESPGGLSHKWRAPAESLYGITGGSSSACSGSSNNSPLRNVRRRLHSSPPTPENSQQSSRPSSPLPRRVLWITPNRQQRTPTPPPFCQDEDATCIVLPAVQSADRVMSDNISFCEPTGGSLPLSPDMISHEFRNTQHSSWPSSWLPSGVHWISRNGQQHTTSPPPCPCQDEHAPSTVFPSVQSVGRVSQAFAEPTDCSLPVSPNLLSREVWNTQQSSQPSSPLPHRELWISQNGQHNTLNPPPCPRHDEDVPSTVLPAMQSVGQVMSGSESFCEQTDASLPVSHNLVHSSPICSVLCNPSSHSSHGLLSINQDVLQCSPNPPCLTREETSSTLLPAVLSAVQVTSAPGTPQHNLSESTAAAGRAFQAQLTLSSGIPNSRSDFITVIPSSTSRTTSLTRDEDPSSPDFTSVLEYSMAAIRIPLDFFTGSEHSTASIRISLDTWTSDVDYGSYDDDAYLSMDHNDSDEVGPISGHPCAL
jgi:hypothetical protein